jgi:pimeloyl-ACP methyl ester carboxylesterase
MLVHGSGMPGWGAWEAVRPLASRYRLVLPHRSGYPPNPPLDRIDFEQQADEIAALVEPGMHLVGHSYGAVVSLLAAARVPDRVRSLTVIEPPAFGVARGNAAVEELIDRLTPIFERTDEDLLAFVRDFRAAVGASPLRIEAMSPAAEQVTRAERAERPPWEAQIPFEALGAAGIPTLVVSGGHSAAFDAVCDVMVQRLGAEREEIRGAGHSPQRLGEAFNRRIAIFVDTIEGRSRHRK